MQHVPLKVFLADDDPDDRLFFADALSELTIKSDVTFFQNGVELMDHLLDLDTPLPNLLFLDLNMPLKGGIDCLKEIRGTEELRNLCVAVYSTSGSPQDVENTFILGANIYIRKPNDYNTLKKVLSEVLQRSWQYETSGLNRENFLLSI
ncbi:MAG: response regulator [Saprospiraceae bacterium]|nr:response regulator [Saprospiraceae bacterium]